MKYVFENFEIDTGNRTLTRDSQRIALQARAFDCLSYLVEHAGELVTKNDVMSVIWADTFVEESSLTVAICTIRRVLGEQHKDRRYIQTVSGRGYRFVCTVHPITPAVRSGYNGDLVGKEISQAPFAPAFNPSAPPHIPDVPDISNPPSTRPRISLLLFAFAAIVLLFAAAGIWRSVVSRPSVSSVAVLPFTREGGDGDDSELLGVADSVVMVLDHEFSVRQMSAVLQYSSRDAKPDAVGRQLGTDAVITGKFSRTGDSTVAHLSLVRSSDGHPLWAQNIFIRTGEEQQVQAQIASLLRIELHRFHNASRLAVPPVPARTTNPEAYQFYLRGRYFWALRTEKSLQQGIGYFKQSIESDPKFALAYAGLADSYALQADLSIVPGKTCGPDARAAAFGAIALDSQLAGPHAALGMVSFFSDWNGLEGEKEFQRAISLDPNYATAHHWYALDLAAMGRLQQALYEIRRAQALEPLSLIIGTNVGWILYLNHDYAAAIRQYAKVLELAPDFARARTRMGIAQMESGDPQAAIANLQAALKISGNDPYVVGLLGQAEAMTGHMKEAQMLLYDLQSRYNARYVPPFSRALIYIGLADKEHALSELEKAAQDRSTALIYARVDPSLDSLRSSARFQDLISKMHF